MSCTSTPLGGAYLWRLWTGTIKGKIINLGKKSDDNSDISKFLEFFVCYHKVLHILADLRTCEKVM